jgi:uncharacterized protein
MSTPAAPPTPRTRIRRVADRGRYDAETVTRIIDAAWHCHVAFSAQNEVHCIPMACWRQGDTLYIHGSNGSRLMKTLAAGANACVTITHLDGLVLARSAFHHSMNYRSVVIYGRCRQLSDAEKFTALEHFIARIAPRRALEARPPDRNELAATLILALPIAEAAAKIREGGPKDDLADMPRPTWAGILPLRLQQLPAIRDAACQITPPDYVRNWNSRDTNEKDRN